LSGQTNWLLDHLFPPLSEEGEDGIAAIVQVQCLGDKSVGLLKMAFLLIRTI
jgi:hypothetical protein